MKLSFVLVFKVLKFILIFKGESLFHRGFFCFYFQIHVIKPVLPKLKSLFEYAVSEEDGNGYFYFDFCNIYSFLFPPLYYN